MSAAHEAGKIPVRKMNFEFDAVPRDYLNGNLAFSNFFNGMNLLFPEGERFFMHAVRDGLKKIDNPSEELSQQAKGFYGQEAQHSIEHLKYFEILDQNGYQFRDELNKFDQLIIKLRKKLPVGLRLAMTAGAEHLTAIAGGVSLLDKDVVNAHPLMRDLMQWHAFEEIEHKAVAFDVYRQFVNNEFMRKRVMVLAVGSLLFRLAKYQRMLLKAKKHRPSWKEWKQAFHFFWNKEHGMMRHTLKALLPFFKTGFHPWDIDQFELIDGWQERFPDVAELQM